jgi:hypothetical protein
VSVFWLPYVGLSVGDHVGATKKVAKTMHKPLFGIALDGWSRIYGAKDAVKNRVNSALTKCEMKSN